MSKEQESPDFPAPVDAPAAHEAEDAAAAYKYTEVPARFPLDVNDSLYEAARQPGLAGKIASLVDANADVNEYHGIHFPLITALASPNLLLAEKLENIQILLDFKANVNIIERGWTPLYYASLTKQPDIIKLLINNGADKAIVTSKFLRSLNSPELTFFKYYTLEFLLSGNKECLDALNENPTNPASHQTETSCAAAGGHTATLGVAAEAGPELG